MYNDNEVVDNRVGIIVTWMHDVKEQTTASMSVRGKEKLNASCGLSRFQSEAEELNHLQISLSRNDARERS